jgi:N6-adenosine-specific RNA methylase IME4
MPVDKIEALPIRKKADPAGCHLYLWVTHRFLPDGLRLMAAWGFKYHCLLTWIKPEGMVPFSWMFSTEHVLFGYRGKFACDRPGLRVHFEAPRTGHSRKPDVFYDRARAFSPGPRLAMFEREQREGFEVWGNELPATPAENVG